MPLRPFNPAADMNMHPTDPRLNGGAMADREVTTTRDKPVPRDPRTPACAEEVRVRNRRREYLQRNPSYFTRLDHEMADPALYERLVRRFQTADERAAEGKAKGYGRTLEASLVRGENRLAELAAAQADESTLSPEPSGASENAWDDPAVDGENGIELWRAFLEDRFVRGGDEEFDYALVDGDEDLDVLERSDAQDKWFDDEEPEWASDRDTGPRGQTGLQDY